MNANQFRELLKEIGADFSDEAVQHGTKFKGPGGELFIVYDSGKVVFQGKRTPLAVRIEIRLRGNEGAEEAVAPVDPNAAPVFIVYGHDVSARDGLELLLRRMGLAPIVLANLPAAGDTIIEKLERYLGEHGKIGFACVLLTPDDQGHRQGMPLEIKYRARQNVVLELGMVLSRLGRSRVAILHKKSIELPSDIAGLIYIPFEEHVDELKAQLFKELGTAGYQPKADGL